MTDSPTDSLREMVRQSGFCIILLTEDYYDDLKAAFELGTAILFDKPLLVLRREGVSIGTQLERVATVVETWSSGEDMQGAVTRGCRRIEKLLDNPTFGVGVFPPGLLREDGPDARPETPDRLNDHIDGGRDQRADPPVLP